MAETIQLDVSLGLQQAISQAESLRRVLQQSVRPDSSAYRAIEGMLNKVTQQAEMFKQTMGESLKTSSGTKTFTNKLQQTINLLGVAAERLSSVKGKDLIFEDSDLQRIQALQTQVQQVEEHIKELRKNKVGNFFADDTVSEFKQIQELAERMHIDISKMTFSELQNAISKELRDANNSIDQTKEKIQQLDSVLKNTNINDINKLTQGLNSKMAGNTIEVFKADNLTEANRRLQNFYEGFEKYFGKIKSTIKEGNPVSAVLENESKEINSVLSERLASLKSQQDKLQQAYNALQTITIGKGQKKDEKLNIIEAQQSVLNEIGFAKITDNQNADAYAKQARQAITAALDKIKLEEQDFEQIRISMLDGIQFVFAGLDTDKIIGNAKGLKQSFTQWLSGEGVDVKDNAIVQAFDAIKNKADVSTVINTIVTALEHYINKTKEVRAEQEQSQAEQQTYAASLAQSNDTVNQAVATQENAINVAQLTMEQLRTVIEQIIATREKEQATLGGQKKSLDDNTNAYQNLIEELKRYNAELIKSEERTKTLGNIRTAITNWMGFNQVMQLTKRAVSEAINHIKQLDTTMNGIAIVTDMTTADLWKQVDAYSDMAQNFGVTIQGAYEVSKIYYQAGYETNEVLTLTNETLKLAKISGLDYATTTDYMMTAMRGFKLEMEDASRVVDVYSNLAANTAVSQQELAEAMTRTASSMESVGATFEETSAMIATMVAVTRESANNIGSAMKSIASRYGELTKDPAALFDAEGEAMSFNKVDEALRSVGITLQTTDHQFRDFTDVILELADKWDTLDSAAQRYVATQFAGNRQQSRFLALVGNVDLLRQNIANAENSEDVGTLQALKALDSLESKLNQVQVAYQQFYTTIGIENVWKALLDSTTNVINTLNGLPKLFGVIPANAISMVYSVITLIKTVLLNGSSSIATTIKDILDQTKNETGKEAEAAGQQFGERFVNGANKSLEKLKNSFNPKGNLDKTLNTIGSLSVTIGALLDKTTEGGRQAAGALTGIGGAIQVVSAAITVATSTNPWGALLTVASTVLMGIMNLANGISIAFESSEERLARLTKEAENLNNEAKKAKAEYNTLQRSVDKINELNEKRYESVEATEEYHDAVNELADSFPQLIIGFDDAGNAIINMENAEILLAEARRKTTDATLDAIKGEREKKREQQKEAAKKSAEYLSSYSQTLGELISTDVAEASVGKKIAWGILGAILGENFLSGDFTGKDLKLEKSPTDKIIENYDGLITQEDLNLLEEWQEILNFSEESLLIEDNLKRIYSFQEKINLLAEQGDHLWDFLLDSDSQWTNFIKSLGDIQPLQKVNENLRRKEISLTLSQKYGEEGQLNNTLLNQLATGYLMKFGGEEIDINEYAQAEEVVIKWWESLKDNQELALQAFENLPNYSLKDFQNIFNISDENDLIWQAFEEYYNSQGVNVVQQIRNLLIDDEAFGQEINKGTFNSQLGLSLVSEAINLFTDYENKGLSDNADQIRIAAANIFDTLGSISEKNIQQFVELQQLIHQNGFSTQEQIQSTIDALQSNIDSNVYDSAYVEAAQAIIDSLYNMQEQLVYNYIASLKASYETNIEKYTNDMKTLSKLSKGMGIDEVYEFLTSSLNNIDKPLNFDNFHMDSSGSYKVDADTLDEYFNSYINKIYHIDDDIAALFESIFAENNYDPEELLKNTSVLAKLGFNEEEYGNITVADLEERIDEFIENYRLVEKQIAHLRNQAYAQLSIAIGDYTPFIDDGLDIKQFASSKFGANDVLKREAQKALNDVYSTLISDVLSKGFKYINPEDYTGLIKGKPVTLTGISYQQFVREYVDYTGKTVEEINDLIFQAIEKDTAKTSGAAQDALKNVTFFREDIAYASIDTIKALADAFGTDIRNLYNSSTYNEALGAYQLILDAVDFSGITNSVQIVSDSVQEALESIANLISNGIKGTLSNEGRATLISNLDILGIDVKKLDFTQTAEGLQLSTESAIYLYSELKNIDSIRAHLVFDSLKDSLTEAGEACENITSTVSEIARLEKELRKPENENNQILNDRLALYKEIAREQALSDPSQFSFMNRNLSNGMQGPVNYWNDVSKAFKVMKEAKSSGYMDFEDYVNIVNEWARTAELSGEELVIGGQHFANSSEMADYLIQRGISAFTEIDGEGMKVSLAALGENAQIGVEDMSAGINAAVKQMAQSQMDMLDAQIKFLEGVVALEKLGEDGIEFNEIFNLDENGFKFTEDYIKGINNLEPIFSKIQIGGNTLYEVLTQTDLALEQFDNPQNFIKFLTSVYEFFNNFDWTADYKIEDVIANFQKIVEQDYPEITTTLAIGIDEEGVKDKAEKAAQTAHDRMERIFAERSDKRNKTPAYYSNSINENTTETSDNKQVVDVQYSDSTPAGLQELIESIDTPLTRTITTENSMNVTSVTTEDGIELVNGFYQVKTQSGSLEISASIGEVVGLEETISENGEKGYKIILVNGEGFSIPAAIDGENVTGMVPNEGGTSYTINLSNGNGFSIPAKINDQQVVGMDYDSQKGTVTLKTNDGNGFILPAKVDNNNLIGITEKDGAYYLNLDNNQSINITGQLVGITQGWKKGQDGDPNQLLQNLTGALTQVIEGWVTGGTGDPNLLLSTLTGYLTQVIPGWTANGNGDPNLLLKSLTGAITGVVQGWVDGTTGDPNLLLQGLNGALISVLQGWKNGEEGDPNNLVKDLSGSVKEIILPHITVTPTLDTSLMSDAYAKWLSELPLYEQGIIAGDLYGPPNPNLPQFNNNVSSETTEKNTEVIADNTEQVKEHSEEMSKAAIEAQNSADKITAAGKNISSASSRVVTAEESLRQSTKTLTYSVTNAANTIKTLTYSVTNAANTINNVIKNIYGYAPMTSDTTLGLGTQATKPKDSEATGNIALATGRPTLMGELGPELYVTNGHYYVAGQNGAEFVNLPDDAIVFNHLQTARLLTNGNTGRGKPVTNERKATSYAKGNIAGGPAKASAAAVLAELKRIRAEWKSLFDAGARDLGSLAGSGGGSGGGGGNDKWQQKTTTAEIQRWYNLIRQIAKLEEDISYQETLQSKIESDRIANGHALYKSYKQELDLLKQEITANEELSLLQRSWYDAKRAELAASDYGKIFTYNENGLQQYTGSGAPGSGLGLDILENLTRRDVYGQAIDNAATAQKQLEYLKSLDFNIENLKYNDDGTTIDLTNLKNKELDDAYVQMMENFWSNVDSWRDELDSIYDSYNEQLENVLSNQNKQNEIMQKIIDNQLDVEKKVLNAIEEREQKRIDDAQDERDALSDSADRFLNGLSDQLNKEREMYSRNENQDELNQLRRQLAILTRTGGSSSQIRSLQDQINSKSQEQYFTSQQDQIDAIKEASDAQLERLDTQIDLMTETLEYQKENGLLWAEVYEVMARTPSEIQDFITNNTPDFQSNSALQVAEDLRELKLKIEQWVDYREDLANGNDVTNEAKFDDFYNTQKPFYSNVDEAALSKARDTYNAVLGQTGDTNAAMQAAMNTLEGYKKKPESVTGSTGSASSDKVSGTGGTSGGSRSGGSSGSGSGNTSGFLREGSRGEDVRRLQLALQAQGPKYSTVLGPIDGIFGKNTRAALQIYQAANGLKVDGIFGPATRKKLYGYSNGGLVDYTGLAMVHGSPQDPESFLDATHTKLLKQDMLMREQLMPSLLSTYNEAIKNNTGKSLLNQNNQPNMIIENVDLKLQIDSLSNDYDVRRAVEVMKSELLNISRRSGTIGVNRR